MIRLIIAMINLVIAMINRTVMISLIIATIHVIIAIFHLPASCVGTDEVSPHPDWSTSFAGRYEYVIESQAHPVPRGHGSYEDSRGADDHVPWGGTIFPLTKPHKMACAKGEWQAEGWQRAAAEHTRQSQGLVRGAPISA